MAQQLALAPRVIDHAPPGFSPTTAAGLDVAYEGDTGRLAAAAVCVDIATGETVDQAVILDQTDFPYIPGLFAYRELPSLLKALAALTTTPDLLVCDGQGRAHPRRFGLASHAGLETGIPSIGVGKNALGEFTTPAPERGSWTPLTDDGEVIGRTLRTQDGVKPLFVSIGHRIDLDTATALVLTLCRKYRQPETTRAADHLCREALKGG